MPLRPERAVDQWPKLWGPLSAWQFAPLYGVPSLLEGQQPAHRGAQRFMPAFMPAPPNLS